MELKLSGTNSLMCTFPPCTTLHFSLNAVKRTQKPYLNKSKDIMLSENHPYKWYLVDVLRNILSLMSSKHIFAPQNHYLKYP